MSLTRLCRYLLFASILLQACAQSKLYVLEHKEQQYIVAKTTPGDSALINLIAPYKKGVDTQMQVLIGHTDIPLTKAQPESTLGNFVADATLSAARKLDPKVVAAVSNYGGIRLPYISPGPINRGKMYELMPFDNMLTIVEIPGYILQQFCDSMAMRKGWPVSGLTYTIRDRRAVDVYVGKLPLNSSLVYKIATSDYVAKGGDNCVFLQPLRKRHTTLFIRDALIDYLAALEAEQKPLHPVLDKRIRYAE
jgi:2',3'-cyclic-nucleotide 2'-phosphodiesterase (5'-nucleotidase family)